MSFECPDEGVMNVLKEVLSVDRELNYKLVERTFELKSGLFSLFLLLFLKV